MIARAKKALYGVLETPSGSVASRITGAFLVTLIVANVAALTVGTVRSVAIRHSVFFRWFEVVSVFFFTIEYLLRAWVVTENPAYGRSLTGRIRYLLSPLAIVDLMAIVPFYLPMLIPVNLLFLRALRLMRLLRLLKLGRYSDAIVVMGSVFKAKREAITVAIGMSLVLLLLSSSLMYFIEGNAQPEAFSSIPASMWWAVTTMTTVGYGDVVPVTPAGKVLAAVIALLGISLFILPAGIIAAGYAAEIQRRRDLEIVCPKCGNVIS